MPPGGTRRASGLGFAPSGHVADGPAGGGTTPHEAPTGTPWGELRYLRKWIEEEEVRLGVQSEALPTASREGQSEFDGVPNLSAPPSPRAAMPLNATTPIQTQNGDLGGRVPIFASSNGSLEHQSRPQQQPFSSSLNLMAGREDDGIDKGVNLTRPFSPSSPLSILAVGLQQSGGVGPATESSDPRGSGVATRYQSDDRQSGGGEYNGGRSDASNSLIISPTPSPWQPGVERWFEDVPIGPSPPSEASASTEQKPTLDPRGNAAMDLKQVAGEVGCTEEGVRDQDMGTTS